MRWAASVTFVVRDTDSGAQDRGAVALEDDVVRTGEVRSAVADQEPDVLERLERRSIRRPRHGHRRGRHSARPLGAQGCAVRGVARC